MPDELTFKPQRLSALGGRFHLEFQGPDLEVIQMGVTSRPPHDPLRTLSYARTASYFEEFIQSGIGACITRPGLARALPPERGALVTDEDPEAVFYRIYSTLAKEGRWSVVPSACGERNQIAPTAVIHDGVQMGNDCRIMDHVVVLPNTVIGDRVVIKPNTTLGGDGYEPRLIDGRLTIVPHVGGVHIGDDVEIGASVCIDRSLFGNFTVIGRESKIDSLVYVAHGVKMGARCRIVGCCQISGGTVLGDGVHLAPNTVVNQMLRIGDFCYIGSGAVVTRSFGNYVLAFGSPARQHGWACICGKKIELQGEEGQCAYCAERYRLSGENLEHVGG